MSSSSLSTAEPQLRAQPQRRYFGVTFFESPA